MVLQWDKQSRYKHAAYRSLASHKTISYICLARRCWSADLNCSSSWQNWVKSGRVSRGVEDEHVKVRDDTHIWWWWWYTYQKTAVNLHTAAHYDQAESWSRDGKTHTQTRARTNRLCGWQRSNTDDNGDLKTSDGWRREIAVWRHTEEWPVKTGKDKLMFIAKIVWKV